MKYELPATTIATSYSLSVSISNKSIESICKYLEANKNKFSPNFESKVFSNSIASFINIKIVDITEFYFIKTGGLLSLSFSVGEPSFLTWLRFKLMFFISEYLNTELNFHNKDTIVIKVVGSYKDFIIEHYLESEIKDTISNEILSASEARRKYMDMDNLLCLL